MEKLRSIARTNEVNGTAIRILKLYEDDAPAHADSYLAGLVASLAAKSAQMSEAIKMGRAESDLEDADLARDAAIRSLLAAVGGYAALTATPALAQPAQPAQRLQKILDRYGAKIARESYTAESSLIEALLTDLKAAEPAADIAALPGIAPAVQQIRAAEDDFLTRQAAYEKAAAGHKNLPSPTSLKPQMLALINEDLLLHLSAMRKAQPATFAALADAVAKAVADANTAIKQRSTKGKDDGKAEN